MARKPTPKDRDAFRSLLLTIRREIRGDIGALEDDAFGTSGERLSVDSPADTGSESFAQEFSLELLARDEQTLGEVDAALGRIEDGTFGRCEGCEAWIAKARLQAMPYARKCIDCQREAENGF